MPGSEVVFNSSVTAIAAQGSGSPAQGIHSTELSQSKTVLISFMVHGSPSSQGIVDTGPSAHVFPNVLVASLSSQSSLVGTPSQSPSLILITSIETLKQPETEIVPPDEGKPAPDISNVPSAPLEVPEFQEYATIPSVPAVISMIQLPSASTISFTSTPLSTTIPRLPLFPVAKLAPFG